MSQYLQWELAIQSDRIATNLAPTWHLVGILSVPLEIVGRPGTPLGLPWGVPLGRSGSLWGFTETLWGSPED